MARTTNCTQATAIRRGQIRLRIEHMRACRIGLHDREPTKRHAKRCAPESRVDPRSEFRKELRCACEIVRILFLPLTLLGRKVHDAKREVEPAWLDDDGGVQPVDRRIVRKPGSRELLYCAAEARVVAEGEREEVCGASWC